MKTKVGLLAFTRCRHGGYTPTAILPVMGLRRAQQGLGSCGRQQSTYAIPRTSDGETGRPEEPLPRSASNGDEAIQRHSGLDRQSNKIAVFNSVEAFKDFRWGHMVGRTGHGRRDATVGLVPTMGALHGGHAKLVRQAARDCDKVVVSIYVNPTQFGVSEDLSTYPRTLEADLAAIKALNDEFERDQTGAYRGRVAAVVVPSTREMYPSLPPTSEVLGDGSFVTITPLGSILEGKSRPVFFRGVATVCMKLFNMVQPSSVFFGRKDAQQLAVIKRMVRDFHMPLRVVAVDTQREDDGLAMSSRNVYLGARRRQAALSLWRSLRAGLEAAATSTERTSVRGAAMAVLQDEHKRQVALDPSKRALFDIDYVSYADADSLEEVERLESGQSATLSVAVIMHPIEGAAEGEELGYGGDRAPVRLIDNTTVVGV